MNKRTALATLLLAVAAAAHAGTPDIPDDINARLARAKSQQASDTATRGGALATLAGATAIGGVGGAASSAPPAVRPAPAATSPSATSSRTRVASAPRRAAKPR